MNDIDEKVVVSDNDKAVVVNGTDMDVAIAIMSSAKSLIPREEFTWYVYAQRIQWCISRMVKDGIIPIARLSNINSIINKNFEEMIVTYAKLLD